MNNEIQQGHQLNYIELLCLSLDVIIRVLDNNEKILISKEEISISYKILKNILYNSKFENIFNLNQKLNELRKELSEIICSDKNNKIYQMDENSKRYQMDNNKNELVPIELSARMSDIVFMYFCFSLKYKNKDILDKLIDFLKKTIYYLIDSLDFKKQILTIQESIQNQINNVLNEIEIINTNPNKDIKTTVIISEDKLNKIKKLLDEINNNKNLLNQYQRTHQENNENIIDSQLTDNKLTLICDNYEEKILKSSDLELCFLESYNTVTKLCKELKTVKLYDELNNIIKNVFYIKYFSK